MIITRLQGGLGNQLFQYAAGRALSLRLATDLVIDTSWYTGRIALGDTSRPYELDIFSVAGRKATTAEERGTRYIESSSSIHRRLLYLARPNVPKFAALWEQGHQFNPSFLTAPDNSCLIGFWQSEKYFSDFASEIHKDFVIKPSASKQNQELLKKINGKTTSVSLHVRRGDYVSNADAAKFHGLKGLDYYRAAIELVLDKASNLELYVFSDDPQWCRDNLKFNLPIHYIDHNAGSLAYEDLRLMSNCAHNIIANSSFSWWGAWLNQNPDKIVVGPKAWFNDESINTSDVLPPQWIAL